MYIFHQVYNTLCRVFPRRFILPLSVNEDTPYDCNLNNRPDSTATSMRTAKDKVGSQHDPHVNTQEIVKLELTISGYFIQSTDRFMT